MKHTYENDTKKPQKKSFMSMKLSEQESDSEACVLNGQTKTKKNSLKANIIFLQQRYIMEYKKGNRNIKQFTRKEKDTKKKHKFYKGRKVFCIMEKCSF